MKLAPLPLKLPAVLKRRSPWVLLHHAVVQVALLFLFCDLIAQANPWFEAWWKNRAHFLVGLAEFLGCFGETILIYLGHGAAMVHHQMEATKATPAPAA